MKKSSIIILSLAAASVALAWRRSAEDIDISRNTAEVPAVYKKIYGAGSITSDGTYIYIKTSGIPDHKSVYFPSSNSLYEDFRGTTYAGNRFGKNPGSISAQNFTFRIPANPKEAARHSPTHLGPIGVA